jgi:hypothetical protein
MAGSASTSLTPCIPPPARGVRFLKGVGLAAPKFLVLPLLVRLGEEGLGLAAALLPVLPEDVLSGSEGDAGLEVVSTVGLANEVGGEVGPDDVKAEVD